MPILSVQHLTKRYGTVTAVNDVSFSIRQGSCFGLLGPNGAGKTTTIEVIEDILSPTSGEILYKGRARGKNFHEEIGIQFQHTALLSFLKVHETLKTFQRLYRRRADIERLIAQCHLEAIRDKLNDKLSGGQRQRLLFAIALVNRPSLLFLDEPSTGLDPQARRHLWQLIQDIKQTGKTIILTTHYMEEAQHLCDEIVIIDRGEIIAQGSPEELIQQHCQEVTISLPKDALPMSPEAFPLDHTQSNRRLEIQAMDAADCIKTLLSLEVDIRNLTVRSPNLEDVFLILTGRRLRN